MIRKLYCRACNPARVPRLYDVDIANGWQCRETLVLLGKPVGYPLPESPMPTCDHCEKRFAVNQIVVAVTLWQRERYETEVDPPPAWEESWGTILDPSAVALTDVLTA